MIENIPRCGIGVMIVKNNKVLLGRRKGSHGSGEFAFPGGHMEYMESFKDCALRELSEECGKDFKVKNIQFVTLANVMAYNPKHYVLIGLSAEWESGEPKVMEEEKCEGWDWYDFNNFPQPLFQPTEIILKCYWDGMPYLDSSEVLEYLKK